MLGTARFVADQAIETILERTALRTFAQRLVDLAPSRDDESDLLDRSSHIALFSFRERHLLETVARRLRRAANADKPFEIFTASQEHMLALARAHVDRTLLESFVTAIDGCADPGARALLERVCDLFVLSSIEADRAWFMEHGRLTAKRSKAIVAMVAELCALLRPYARVLVDGFGIPDEAIIAPIATGAEARRQSGVSRRRHRLVGRGRGAPGHGLGQQRPTRAARSSASRPSSATAPWTVTSWTQRSGRPPRCPVASSSIGIALCLECGPGTSSRVESVDNPATKPRGVAGPQAGQRFAGSAINAPAPGAGYGARKVNENSLGPFSASAANRSSASAIVGTVPAGTHHRQVNTSRIGTNHLRR